MPRPTPGRSAWTAPAAHRAALPERRHPDQPGRLVEPPVGSPEAAGGYGSGAPLQPSRRRRRLARRDHQGRTASWIARTRSWPEPPSRRQPKRRPASTAPPTPGRWRGQAGSSVRLARGGPHRGWPERPGKPAPGGPPPPRRPWTPWRCWRDYRGCPDPARLRCRPRRCRMLRRTRSPNRLQVRQPSSVRRRAHRRPTWDALSRRWSSQAITLRVRGPRLPKRTPPPHRPRRCGRSQRQRPPRRERRT